MDLLFQSGYNMLKDKHLDTSLSVHASDVDSKFAIDIPFTYVLHLSVHNKVNEQVFENSLLTQFELSRQLYICIFKT